MRVAIVHEKITVLAGSERVVEQLHVLYPDATVHVPIVDRTVLPPGLADADIRPTPLQRLYRGGQSYAYLLPLLPLAFARIDVGDVDLVITSHHQFANRVRVPASIPVVSYTYTPARWIWDPTKLEDEIGGSVGRAGLRLFALTQRRPDRAAAHRARGIIADSRHVAGRVARWWDRPDAHVVVPPVDVARFTLDPSIPREDFFLLAGRLVPYKRPVAAVEAARRAGVRLVVAGDGRMRSAVEDAAGPGIEVLGEVDDDTLRHLYQRCRALVFPGEEDFGIVPVEAQACGAPVLARAIGGVLDSVVDGVTGVLYGQGIDDEVGPLADAMRTFDPSAFDPHRIRLHAEGFAPERFRERFADTVAKILGG